MSLGWWDTPFTARVQHERFNAIRAVGEDPSKLDLAKESTGESHYDPVLEAEHDRYMTQFIRNFNAGLKKHVVPTWRTPKLIAAL